MLSEDRLPDHLLPLCLDVLREVANNERDYILIIVEEIQDLLEPLRSSGAVVRCIFSPGTPTQLTLEQDTDDRDSILARCLRMCYHSLERVTSVRSQYVEAPPPLLTQLADI